MHKLSRGLSTAPFVPPPAAALVSGQKARPGGPGFLMTRLQSASTAAGFISGGMR